MNQANSLSSKKIKLLDELDWDCTDQFHQKTSLNIIHWYPGSFITAIPGNLIDVLSSEGDVIWDPFCGSGTTAVEAYRKGRNFIGTDINEIGILISKAKLHLLQYRETYLDSMKKAMADVGTFEENSLFNNAEYYDIGVRSCNLDQLKDWYLPKVLDKLVSLRGYLVKYENDEKIYSILMAVFLTISKLACAQQKTWGHIADNVKPSIDQIATRQYDVIKNYILRLKQIHDKSLKVLLVSSSGSYKIELGDAKNYNPSTKVDLVITSPPYPSMADYITSQRIAFYWLNYDQCHINTSKQNEIGARYLRHNAKKNDKYLTNMVSAFENISSNIKRNGFAALLMPEYSDSDMRKPVIDAFYDKLSHSMALEHKIYRNVTDTYRWSPFKKLKNECLTVWRR